MNAFSKITVERHKYITGMNLTPNIIVLGYAVWADFNKELEGLFEGFGKSYIIGMKVVVDFGCPDTLAVSYSEVV